MNRGLSKSQKAKLLHLSTKRHIEVCTSIGRAFGNTFFADGSDAKSIMPSLNTFFSWGFFDHEERLYHGMRYSRLTINNRGMQALAHLEVTDV